MQVPMSQSLGDLGVPPAPAGACCALTGGTARPAPPVAAALPLRIRHG